MSTTILFPPSLWPESTTSKATVNIFTVITARRTMAASTPLQSTLRPSDTFTSPHSTTFPFLNLRAQFEGMHDEVISAVLKVLDRQEFILGSEVQAFESEVAQSIGARFAIGCASGSDALLLALLALKVGVGDEVITTPFTFVATAGAIARVGAKPVFVDIEPQSFNIDPDQIARTTTKRTKAIIPVHLFGLCADMDSIAAIASRLELPLIEDAAQAIGAKYKGDHVGTLGSLACFSFFPSKNLGGAGDGGMLTTDDANLAARLRLLRVHGSDRKYHYSVLGVNSRLDALQAAILRVKLKHLPTWTEGRRYKAALYRRLFKEHGLEAFVQLPSEFAHRYHVYNQFVIRCRERDELRAFLGDRGIPTEIYYPTPLHLQPAFDYLGYRPGDFPHSEAASHEALALPIYPELSNEQQTAVVSHIAAFYTT